MTLSVTNPTRFSRLSRLLHHSWQTNKPLFLIALFSVGLLGFTMFGLVFDQRTLLGEPVWIKPTKFAVSSIFYTLTLMWLLTFIADRRRWVVLISWVTAAAMFIELVLISFQAFRGVRSHFNVVTPFDAAIFSTMGLMILLLWLVSLVALIILVRQPFENRAWGVTLKLALTVTIIGTGLGFLMTSPTAQQLAAAEETGILIEAGAHSVGVSDGGPGLPFVGWSTTGGDLRVGHFIGMHAMQVLPLLGFALLRPRWKLSKRQQLGLVWIVGLVYLGFVALVTWQALRGEPLIYPGPLTLAALGGLITAAGLATAWVLWSGKRD